MNEAIRRSKTVARFLGTDATAESISRATGLSLRVVEPVWRDLQAEHARREAMRRKGSVQA